MTKYTLRHGSVQAFTGQYSYMDDPTTSGVTEGFDLMFYNARWYDPYLNHFTQPDTIVPGVGNPQAWDRYAYVMNNPLRYTDPTGHMNCEEDGYNCPGDEWPPQSSNGFIFSGTYGNPNLPGPNEFDNYGMPAWSGNPNATYIPYIGNQPVGNTWITAKRAQAESAYNLLSNEDVFLICYSGGVESCLMYAKWRIEHHQSVSKVVLLGPTFRARRSRSIKLSILLGFIYIPVYQHAS